MVRERFNDSFDALREHSNRVASTERTADNFDEVVEHRVELDRLRDEVDAARKEIVSRFEPDLPDYVDPPRGYQEASRFGKVAATVSIVLLVLCGFLLYRGVQSFVAGTPVYFDVVGETLDRDECLWTVSGTLRNETNYQLTYYRVETVLNRRMVAGQPDFRPTIPAGESAPLTLKWNIGSAADCPASVDAIDHGNLRLSFNGGGITASRGLG